VRTTLALINPAISKLVRLSYSKKFLPSKFKSY
jgi:hypothetical protein